MLRGQRPIRGCWSRGLGKGGKTQIHTPLFELWQVLLSGCRGVAKEVPGGPQGRNRGMETAAVLELWRLWQCGSPLFTLCLKQTCPSTTASISRLTRK